MGVHDTFLECGASFKKVELALSQNNGHLGADGPLIVGELTEQHIRLNIWANDTNIHRLESNTDSYHDFLRQNEDLHTLVREILSGINDTLNDALDNDLTTAESELQTGIASSSGSESDYGFGSTLDDIRCQIDSLLDLGPLLREHNDAVIHNRTSDTAAISSEQVANDTARIIEWATKRMMQPTSEREGSDEDSKLWLWQRLAEAGFERKRMIERRIGKSLNFSNSISAHHTHADLKAHPFILPRPLSNQFDCPYCNQRVSLSDDSVDDWRSHILQDIFPYICTFKNCSTPSTLFATRAELLFHEGQHRRKHFCREHGCQESFEHRNGMKSHLLNVHADISNAEIELILELGCRIPTVFLAGKCDFCGVLPFTRLWEDIHNIHTITHLEDVALMMLCNNTQPQTYKTESDSSFRHTRLKQSEDPFAQNFNTRQSPSPDFDIEDPIPSPDFDIEDPIRDLTLGQHMLPRKRRRNSLPDGTSNANLPDGIGKDSEDAEEKLYKGKRREPKKK